jgi:hypothetical protein
VTGDFREARSHLELAASLYGAEEDREFVSRYGHDMIPTRSGGAWRGLWDPNRATISIRTFVY